eukprot:gene9568-9644_t
MISLEARILQLRHKQACIALQLALKRAALVGSCKFDANQPRDDHGRWTSGGGDSAVVTPISDSAGFTKHGINQAINRGVAPADMLDAVVNPLKIIPQSNGTVRYIGESAVVVLNPAGKVVTVWADDPHAQDEYDAYIVPVMNLLTGSASQQCIADDLLQNEQNMGLEGDHVRALAVAAKLKALIQ